MNKARQFISSNFRLFFEVSSNFEVPLAVAKIGSILEPNHHNEALSLSKLYSVTKKFMNCVKIVCLFKNDDFSYSWFELLLNMGSGGIQSGTFLQLFAKWRCSAHLKLSQFI